MESQVHSGGGGGGGGAGGGCITGPPYRAKPNVFPRTIGPAGRFHSSGICPLNSFIWFEIGVRFDWYSLWSPSRASVIKSLLNICTVL